MSIRIAVASTDEAFIDQHFGSARVFQIYDISGDTYEWIGSRRTEAFCRGGCEGGFDHLLEALQDCEAVFVLRIGEGAAAFMIRHGKRVFEASGPVEEIIERIIADHLLESE